MKQRGFSSKWARRFAVVAVILLGVSLSSQAFPFLKKKKKTVPVVKKDAYERALSDNKTDSAKGPFISLYKTGGKLLVELPPSSLGRDMLVGATVSSVSSPQFAELGLRSGSLVHIRFVQKDSSIVMQAVNSEMMDSLPGRDPRRTEATNYGDLDFFTFPIKARNKATGGILFDASSFFLEKSRYFPVIAKVAGPYRVDAELKQEWSRVTALKSFATNACVKMERNHIANMSGNSGKVAIANHPVSIGVNFTLALLPEQPMTPRLSDTRIGMFLTPKSIVNDGLLERVSFVNRWRVEPRDTAAYFAGKLTEPVKPIVYYVENTFPELWKKAVKAGILRWNKAFERIGFKDVVQVKDFPTDDPAFAPDNFQYSCVRYLPVSVENAMGPSWVDPRTGEIVTATVLVYNDVINTIDNWRFVQTAQLDPAARTASMPDSIVALALEYIIAHEFRYDPTAIEEDLGDDPLKASDYGLQNLNYILGHFDAWIPDGDGARKAELYRQMVSQAYGYVRNVYANVSGIRLYQTTETSGLPRYRVVPKDRQRAAALWMLDEARRFGKRGVAEIENRLPQLASHPYKTLASGIQEMALSATPRLALSFYLDSTSYSPLEYCDDVYRNVWAKTIAGNEALDEDDIALQKVYVEKLKANVDEVKQVGKVRGLHDAHADESFLGFGSGYGEPETMWMATVDRTAEYVFHYALKLKQLLEERIATTRTPETKAHYVLLHARVQKYLNT